MAGSDYNAFFCWNCGEKVDKNARECSHCGAQYTSKRKYGSAEALGAGGVGWSVKADDPFFHKYASKYTKISIVWMIVLSLLIPAILLFSGQVEPEGEGLVVLIAIPTVLWVIGLIFLAKKFGGRDKSWDGVVENKTKEQKTRREKEIDHNTRTVFYMEYVITIRQQNGGIKRLVSQDDASNYTYFNIGDHVRFHEKKYLKYLEKYDKSHDTELFCAACGTLNDARDNYCGRCGAPMLKGNPNIPPSYTVPVSKSDVRLFYCASCGSKLTGGAFCESCGVKVQ